jgi:tetratricopeptide (TPR) repeat protein
MDALRRAEQARRAQDKEEPQPQAPEPGQTLTVAGMGDAPDPQDVASPESTVASERASPTQEPEDDASADRADGMTDALTLSLSPPIGDNRYPREHTDAETISTNALGTRSGTWARARTPLDSQGLGTGPRAGGATPDPGSRHRARAVFGAKRASGRSLGRSLLIAVPVALLLVLALGGYRYWKALTAGPALGSGRAQQAPAPRPPSQEVGRLTLPTAVREPAPPGAPAVPAPQHETSAPVASSEQRPPAFGSFGPAPARTAPSPATVPEPPAASAAAPAPAARAHATPPEERLRGATSSASSALARAAPEIAITRAAKRDPVHVLLGQAYRAFLRGDNATAQARYREVLAREAHNRDAVLGLAAVAVREGRVEEAARWYLTLLRRNPRDSLAQAALIDLNAASDAGAGESRLKRLLEQEPDAPHLHFSLGNLYAQQGRWAKAEQSYFHAYRADSTNPDYALNLAVSLDHLGQAEAALSYYRRALTLAATRQAAFRSADVQERIQALAQAGIRQ